MRIDVVICLCGLHQAFNGKVMRLIERQLHALINILGPGQIMLAHQSPYGCAMAPHPAGNLGQAVAQQPEEPDLPQQAVALRS